jgi:4-cresol dehydrogenase (hydroxylating)
MTQINRRSVLGGAAAAMALPAASIAASVQEKQVASSVMPKGMSRERFLRAVAEYRAVVGAENVLIDEGNLVPYKKIMVPAANADHAAAGAVMPSSSEQVQKIIEISARHLIPLWTVSTGKNFGYGTAAPALPGQVVLDLRRMNRILNFDAALGTVLIEPGVTYQQLSEFLESNNHPFIVTGPGAGPIVGPVGQALERGRGYTPYGDQFAQVCGLEVMLSTGEVLRTGAGGIEKSTAWQADPYGFGPHLTGLFSQSNFGVVTKMGLWLMPKPESYKPFMVGFRSHDDLGRAVDIVQKLRLRGIIQNPTIIGNTMYVVAQMAKRKQVFTGEGAVTDEWHSAFMKNKGGIIWGVNAALYGSPERIAADWKSVQEAFRDSGGILLGDEQLGQDPVWQHMRGMMSGKLSLQEYGIYNWRGGGGSAWFAPVMASRSSDAMKTMALGKSIVRSFGFDYLGGYIVNARDMVMVIDVLFDKTDADETAKARKCFAELVNRFGIEGYGLYRTNIAFMETAAKVYGPTQRSVNRRLKQALDPKGILAPGKSGITLA